MVPSARQSTHGGAISPICQHAAEGGNATAWHLVYLGKFALGGAGLILTESTAVHRRERICTADLGLRKDSQIKLMKEVVDFVHANSGAIGVQLAHAGHMAGSQPLWEGCAALSEGRLASDEEPWQRGGPSALPAGPGWSAPAVLDHEGIPNLIQGFVDSTQRAERAGFDVISCTSGMGTSLQAFCLSMLVTAPTNGAAT